MLATFLTRYIGIGFVILLLTLCIGVLLLSPIFRASCAHVLRGSPRTHFFNLHAVYRLGQPLLVRKDDKKDDNSATGMQHSASATLAEPEAASTEDNKTEAVLAPALVPADSGNTPLSPEADDGHESRLQC